MKAVVCTAYGPPEVLQLRDVEKPTPKDREVLVRIHATAVTASDTIVRGFSLPVWHPMGLMMGLVVGFGKPRNPILGMVLAGEVEAIGRETTQFKLGDRVFAFTGTRFGCYAEYTCLPEKGRARFPGDVPGVMALMPSGISYPEAAAVVYGTALASYFLNKAAVQPGERVLIYGASGAIGTTALQLAKHHYGAQVTAVCSGSNTDLVLSLGADRVLDYTTQASLPDGDRYDLVLDAVGKKKTSPLKLACQTALTPTGRYLSVDEGRPALPVEHLLLVRDLIEAGKFRAVIDRCYPLEQMVEAHRYVDAGHKKGNVVITVMGDSDSGRNS
ncbi:MAG: NAD(P)-dependent alcohol dehydrogenase [Chloroflexi bacterium]|nr:NAD(P)-dependent alcohol dehydrogenase [Chloroflexota bacterium]